LAFGSRFQVVCTLLACSILLMALAACGSDKPTMAECQAYCSRILECDDTGQKNQEWLSECNERCTFSEKEANFLSINKDVIACTEIEDCKEFRICVKSGGDGWNTFEE